MGRYESVRARSGWQPPAGRAVNRRADIPDLLLLSRDPDPKGRRVAAKNLCPCHLRTNDPRVWQRLIELTRDPDAGVRADAVHALADGSPRALAPAIVRALEALYHDPHPGVRRQVRRVLGAYRRTGKINVL